MIRQIPNVLSIIRFTLVLPIFLLIKHGPGPYDSVLLSLIVFAIVTDFLDGYLARRLGSESTLGRVLDPIADKIIMLVGLAALCLYRGFPLSLFAVLAYRDILILILGSFISAKTRSVTVSNFWGKFNTVAVSLLAFLFLLNVTSVLITVFVVICYLSVLVSGGVYLRIGLRALTGNRLYRVIIAIVLSLGAIWTLSVEPWRLTSTEMRHADRVVERPDMRRMLDTYSPVFYLCDDEPFFPIAVESFLDHSRLVSRSPFMFFDSEVPQDKPIDDLMQRFDNSSHYLKIDRGMFDDIRSEYHDVRDHYPVHIYGRVMQVESGLDTSYVLQYWLFFWGSTAGSSNLTWHECDWEVVTYWFDNNLIPVKSGYSQHYYGEIRTWDETPNEDGHPVVFVSRGGHVMHFAKGKHTAYIDSHMRFPLGSDICCDDVRLGSDSYEVIWIDESIPWVRWKGLWGRPTTTELPGPMYRHPQNPHLTLWSYPEAWYANYEN
jgi:CDP-diacylglycerol--glycerol-3-phosphate 3-phosphatidyltransferase